MSQATSRLDNLRTLRFANTDGAFATAFGTLVGGTFLVGFVQLQHGADFWIGALAAIPSLCGLFQIPGSILGRSYQSYKKYIRVGGGIWRLMYVPLLILPLLPISGNLKLSILAVCMVIASLSQAMVGPVYNDWLAALVPQKSRGYFFSRRNAILTAVGACVGLPAGFALDAFGKNGFEAKGFVMIFTVGIVAAGISQYFFDQMLDLKRETVAPARFAEALREFKRPFADPTFRKVLVFFSVFFFGQAFAGNFFSAFALESLHMPFGYMYLFAFMQALGMVASSKPWGFLSDKYGTRPMLALAAFGISLTPTMWLLCYPGKLLQNTILLVTCHFLIGLVWSGAALCQFNILLSTSPAKDRGVYLGAGQTMQSIFSGLAPLAGAALMTYLRPLMPADMAYKGVFLVTMGLRLLAVFFLRGVKEEGSRDIRATLRELSRVSPRGYRAMRQLSRSADVDERTDAMRDASLAHYSLATDEILKALHDPSPKIRREAALALARLGEPRAAEALEHQLQDHPDLVEEETVEALGEIGGPSSVRLLSRYLKSPRSQVRRAAAKALGRLGSRDSIEALVLGASDQGDVELRRAALQALRMIGASEASDTIVGALRDSHPSVRIAAAEAVSELSLWAAASTLREALASYHDDSSAELAYALGSIGNESDIPAILDAAQASESIITRRRCLLGVARLLGVEADVYRLLLLDGMARDTALIEKLRKATKRRPRVRAALERYSIGDERGALEALMRVGEQPALAALVDKPVAELFLIAACFVAKHANEEA